MTYDLLIIGAGAAGIAAARTALSRGKTALVLEARNRIGGRAFTDHSLGQPFDAGAAYIHFAQRNPWVREARRLGIETRLWRGWTHHEPWNDDRPISSEDRERRLAGYGLFWEHLETLDDDIPDVSLEAVASGLDPWARATVANFARLGLGEEPSRLSLYDYLLEWEGPDRIVPSGYGTLVAAAARGLPIRCGVPVQRVKAVSGGFVVETGEGAVSARAVIVTVSVGVLKAGHIAFEPGLPRSILTAFDGLAMGALTKVALRFDGERFGLSSGDDKILLDAPGGSMTFEVWPYERDIVIAVTGGDAGRALCEIGEAGAVEEASRLFSSIIGRDVRPHLLGGRLSGWWSDPYALGGYAYVAPGASDARAALMETGIDGLYLAGEATAGGRFGACMTVAGASIAGWDAATRAINALA
jgi:monoamine oxidase